MTKEFSKLDKAKLDLIRLKSEWETLSDMTLRDAAQMGKLESAITLKEDFIQELKVS